MVGLGIGQGGYFTADASLFYDSGLTYSPGQILEILSYLKLAAVKLIDLT